jgi:hypothetical protein
MHKLYEGTILVLKNVPECDVVEISYMDTVRMDPLETYHIPATLQSYEMADNLCLREGSSRLMTIRYLKSVAVQKSEGILGYREFGDVEITREKVLESEIYEVDPPFRIEEYYDGLFLYFRITELFSGNEIGDYKFHSRGSELVTCHGPIYKICPDRSCAMEYVIYNEGFIYRFTPAVLIEYPFAYKFWNTPEKLYFQAKMAGKPLEIEYSGEDGDVVRSDTSKSPLELCVSDRHIFVGKYKLAFSPSFHGRNLVQNEARFHGPWKMQNAAGDS